MAGHKSSAGKPKPKNYKRAIDGVEIKPSMYYGAKGKMLCGSVNGEMVVDENGQPIPFASIKHTEILGG